MSLKPDKSHWKRVKFGDVIQNVAERVKPADANVDRYIGLEHLDPEVMTVQRWDRPDVVKGQKLRFQAGDVIFGRRRAYQKKVAVAEFGGICSAHALVLRARSDYVVPEFLPVFLSSDYFLNRAISISVGSLSPTVNWRDLKSEEFKLPPIDAQNQLSDLLWAIERYKQSIERKAKELWSLQAKAFETATTSSNVTRLSDWVERIEAGRSPLAAANPAQGEELGVLKVSAIGQGQFVQAENKRLLKATDFREDFQVRAGDILITRANAVVDNVARPCIVDRNFPNLMLSDKTLRIVPRSGYPNRVLLAALQAPAYRAYVRGAVNGTEAKNISQAKLLAGPVPVMRSSELERIANVLASMDTASASLSSEIAAIDTLKRSALAEIFGDN